MRLIAVSRSHACWSTAGRMSKSATRVFSSPVGPKGLPIVPPGWTHAVIEVGEECPGDAYFIEVEASRRAAQNSLTSSRVRCEKRTERPRRSARNISSAEGASSGSSGGRPHMQV